MNETLPGGFLAFLTNVKLEEVDFDAKREMTRMDDTDQLRIIEERKARTRAVDEEKRAEIIDETRTTSAVGVSENVRKTSEAPARAVQSTWDPSENKTSKRIHDAKFKPFVESAPAADTLAASDLLEQKDSDEKFVQLGGYKYMLTAKSFNETEDLTARVKEEFGPGALLADWAYLKQANPDLSELNRFLDKLGLKEPTTEAHLLRDGRHQDSLNRIFLCLALMATSQVLGLHSTTFTTTTSASDLGTTFRVPHSLAKRFDQLVGRAANYEPPTPSRWAADEEPQSHQP